jgi:hypothetical protein
MIDRKLLNYPEQLVLRLSQIERDTATAKRGVDKLNLLLKNWDGDGIITFAALKAALLETVYPVGSIYMSSEDVSPASFLGGTWDEVTHNITSPHLTVHMWRRTA